MSLRESRMVQLHGGQDRTSAVNSRTMAAAFTADWVVNYLALFVRHYPLIRQTCLDFASDGLAVFAVDIERSSLAGSLCLTAHPDRPATAVIGRHSSADLFLDGDPSLALRQLMLILEPVRSFEHNEVRFRVLDLHTDRPFSDEHGRKLESVTAEGPIFLRCGQYALLFLVTGDATNFPERAEEAWKFIPDRVFVEESEVHQSDRPPSRRRGELPDWASGRRPTLVTSVPGPISLARRLPRPDGPLVGKLRVDCDSRTLSLPVGRDAAKRGFLLGRYDRCAPGSSAILTSGGISRVHLLILEIGGEIFAIDTGSTNGTYLADDRRRPRPSPAWPEGTGIYDVADEGRVVRCLRLEHRTELVLGIDYARVRWTVLT